MNTGEIKPFTFSGTMSADTFVTTRERLLHEIEVGMRDEGYVPHLDLIPLLTRSYNAGDDTFDFELTVYGIYTGEEKSLSVAGVTDGKEILKGKYTTPTK